MEWKHSVQTYTYIGIGGFAGGVLLRSFFDFGIPFVVFLFVVAATLGAYSRFANSHTLIPLGLAVLVVGAGIGVLRFEVSEQNIDTTLDAHTGKEIRAIGVVADEPDERATNTHLVIALEQVMTEGRILEVDTNVIAYADQFPKRAYGDRIHIQGELAHPEQFETETGRVFNYPAFLEKDGIYYQMFRPDITHVASGEGNEVKDALFSIKHALLSRIQKQLVEPHAALLGGLLVGAKQSLGEGLLDAFRATGIIHIVVLSGYNVTIVAEAFMRFFSFLSARARFALGAGSILGFMVMVGAGATVVRASVMALLVILARAAGRAYNIAFALALAGFIMVFINPKILAFDPSFQLSFLATVGLIYLVPVLEDTFHFIPRKVQLKEFALATVATQIFVLPLLLFMTGEFSLVAVFVNMLVLAVIPATMLFGFLSGVLSFVHALLALPFVLITYILLSYELTVVRVFDALPFASIMVPPFPAWVVIVLYTGLLYWVWKSSGRYTLTRPDASGTLE